MTLNQVLVQLTLLFSLTFTASAVGFLFFNIDQIPSLPFSQTSKGSISLKVRAKVFWQQPNTSLNSSPLTLPVAPKL